MSDEDAAVASEENSAVADQEEPVEALTLEQRQDELKKSRWNVFLWLGIAVLMFSFALFPMPFSADYDNFTNSAEKDIGLVWGPSFPGEDLFDASMHLEVTATSPPPESGSLIEAYALKVDNCQQNLGEFTVIAKNGTDHAYQHQVMDKTPITGQEYTFEFSLDPGQYCVIVQYIDANGDINSNPSNDLAVKGRVWSSQTIGGLLGIICLSLSAFAFIGAQKHGAHIKNILEDGDESTETKVLASVSSARIAAGPSGPPGAGPSGPPPSAGPSGPPPADEPSSSEPAPVATDAVYEPAENGYFFKKLPDGTYDQTVYVQNADGTYAPYQG